MGSELLFGGIEVISTVVWGYTSVQARAAEPGGLGGL